MKQNLKDITDRITRACEDARRNPKDITLIAVSKNRNADQIKQAIDLGITHFGENRVQEACDKWPALKTKDITLHLIGPLQSNKVKQAASIFDVVHTIDRESLWQDMQKYNWHPPCFAQVNTGEEAQKSGVLPQNLGLLLKQIRHAGEGQHPREEKEYRALLDAVDPCLRKDDNSKIMGLMCIPPVDDNPSLHFAFLNKLARRHKLTQLSMGMSDDFEAAIRCGATHIRIGSALFT